jgi:hypothetical protein
MPESIVACPDNRARVDPKKVRGISEKSVNAREVMRILRSDESDCRCPDFVAWRRARGTHCQHSKAGKQEEDYG